MRSIQSSMRRRKVTVLAAAACLVFSACGSSKKTDATATTAAGGTATTAAGGTATTKAAAAATGTPIVLGAVGSKTGTDIFPEPMVAAQLVFDEVNKAGGINGHPIQYLVEDDADTAEGAAAAAKRLVEDKKVLALVGGGSIVDCAANAKYYAEKKMFSMPGAAACSGDAATMSPVNTGPFLGAMMMWSYMVDVSKAEPLCIAGLNVGLTPVFRDVFKPIWEKTTGHVIKSFITTEPNEDLTNAVTKAKADGCKGILLAYTEPNYIAYFNIAKAQGLTGPSSGITYAMLTSGYSENVLAKIKDNGGEGALSNSEWGPYLGDDDKSKDLADFKKLLNDNKVPLTSFGEGGYLAAKIMVEALKSVKGDYTQESVSAAMAATSYTNTLFGQPFKFTPFVAGALGNTTSKVVAIKGGKWSTVSDWVYWPPKK
jgi:branched-chain amino acid transport system substrate-binding protein